MWGGKDGVSKVVFGTDTLIDISDSTVQEDKMLKNVIGYSCDGEKAIGTIEAYDGSFECSETSSGGSSDTPSKPVLQTKSVTPTKDVQTVTPDSGFDGLSQVSVGAIPDEYIIPTGEKSIKANGTHNVNSYASVNVNVPSSGIDTSDANATASDIVADKTAYVNGEKITGTIVEGMGGALAAFYTTLTDDGSVFLVSNNSVGSDRVIRKNSDVKININKSNLGDATADDVAEGKTFTSKAGLKVVGTAKAGSSSGGGTPATITAGDTPVLASFEGQKVSTKSATKTTLSLTIKKAGTYRFKVAACSSGTSFGTGGNPTVAIYKNGSAVSGASGTVTSNTVECLEFDVTCAAGDVIDVYGTAAGSTYSTTAVTCIALIACINWENDF